MPASHSPTLKEPSAVRYFKKMLIRFGLAKKLKDRKGAIYFQVIWKRIVILLAALAISGYSILVAGAYFFIKYERDFAEIRYFDLYFPHRWDNYRVSRGDYYIDRALRIFGGDEEIDGHPFLLLRTGVGLSPDNRDGRLELARVYEQIGQLPTAIRVMEGRLNENRTDTEYLRTYFMMLFNDIQDATVIDMGERLLAESGEGNERRDHMVSTAVATAYYYRGEPERAEEVIDEYGLLDSRDGLILQTRIEWDRGERDLAISRLEQTLDAGRADHEVYSLLLDFLIESGRDERASRFALMQHFNDPLGHEPLLGLIRVYNQIGEMDVVREEMESYLTEFRRNEEAMHGLSALVGHWGDYGMAERVYRHCEAQGMDTEPPAFHWVQAHVVAGNYRRALNVVQTWDEVPREWERGYAVPLRAQLAVAQFGAGNRGEGELAIGELFSEGLLRPQQYALIADRLTEMGEFSQARRVLTHVRNNYPRYQAALPMLIELDIETHHLADLLANVRRYIAMRQPSREVLEKAYAYIGSDLFLFQAEREDVLISLEDVLRETG